MKLPFCTKPSAIPLLVSVLLSAPLVGFAQDIVMPTPKILYLSREFTKPGKGGFPHESTEKGYVDAMAGNKAAPTYYALSALSGPPRVLFMYGYPSFAAMEEQHMNMVKDKTLMSSLEQTDVADGDMLSGTDSSVWTLRDDLSLNPGFRTGSHMETVMLFKIRPGHMSEWEELVKLVIAGYKKGAPDAHWAAFQEAYGIPGGGFLILTTLKGGSALDAEFASDKNFVEAMGKENMKKLEELEAACVESRQDNLFVMNPTMSNPPDALIKSDPDFWKPKGH